MAQVTGTSSQAGEPAVIGSNSIANGLAAQFDGLIVIQGGILAQGAATATEGTIAGINGSGGAGVQGLSLSSSSFGVSGINNSAWPCIAVIGSSSNGHGVKRANGTGSGITVAPAGCGVWGDSNNGIGVYGASKGSKPAVYGFNDAPSGGGAAISGTSAGLSGESTHFEGVHGLGHGGGQACLGSMMDLRVRVRTLWACMARARTGTGCRRSALAGGSVFGPRASRVTVCTGSATLRAAQGFLALTTQAVWRGLSKAACRCRATSQRPT
jgi:hypothetical protein